MRKTSILILLSIVFYSCASHNSKIVVAEYGGNKIYLDEFEQSYAKNIGGYEKAKLDSVQSYKDFLDLYVNYKLKLRDAVVRGYHNDPDMIKEYNDYKKNIGTTLIIEDKLYTPNLKALYERRKYEYRASHIFFVPDSATNEAQIYKTADEVFNKIKAGEDFVKLVQEYSKDKYSRDRKGDVYYFTAGIILPEIEDAVYQTEVGQVYPKLVKSSSGYHIIKVTEKKTRRAAISAQHILVKYADSTNVTDTAKALQKIKDIESQIKAGADFGDLAWKYSEDLGSARQRGELGSFYRSKMVQEFDEAAFLLKVGEVSNIVQSPFGFHLIKLTKEESIPSFEKNKEELKKMYQRQRYKSDYDSLIASYSRELNIEIDNELITEIASKKDTLKAGSSELNSKLFQEFGKRNIITSNVHSFTCDTLFKAMISKEIINQEIDFEILESSADHFASEAVVSMKAMTYDMEDQEFAKLLEEYKNGMYLFKILEEEVWSKVEVDSAMIQNYYNQNKNSYVWKDRVEFKEIYNQKDSLVNIAYSHAVSGYSFDSLFVRYNQRTGYENKPGFFGLVEVDFNDLAKAANELKNVGDVSKPFKFQDGWSVVKLVAREAARTKTLDECKAQIASYLQEYESKRLETEYINRLKSINKPVYNYDQLENAFKQN